MIVTRRSESVSATDDDGTFATPVRPTTAIDTTGAGDCFTGMLAAGFAADDPLRASIARSRDVAGLVLGQLRRSVRPPARGRFDVRTPRSPAQSKTSARLLLRHDQQDVRLRAHGRTLRAGTTQSGWNVNHHSSS